MSVNAEDIAEYFIHLSLKAGNKGISNKKLQKLVYYAQAWTLALTKKPLFADKFEAWIHGPAIPSLYRKYKKFGFQPVQPQTTDFNPHKLPKTEIIDEVWQVYGKYDADYLEILTHQESPWINARDALEFKESSSNEISFESMEIFYSQKIKAANSKNEQKQ